jgi:hypothetical protein
LRGGAAAAIATIDELLNKAGILLVTPDFFHTHKRRVWALQKFFSVELTYDLIMSAPP